jgi:hypothetical protein
MKLSVKVQSATLGALGFGTNAHLTADISGKILQSEFAFVSRCLQTESTFPSAGLGSSELQIILAAGLTVIVFQHVASRREGPSAEAGVRDGADAVRAAKALFLPTGTQIWLNIDDFANTSHSGEISDYLFNWFDLVVQDGYVPGLQVGLCACWTNEMLDSLPFNFFWRIGSGSHAYPSSGYCLVQSASPSYIFEDLHYERDVVQLDNHGSRPTWLAGVPSSGRAISPKARTLVGIGLTVLLVAGAFVGGMSVAPAGHRNAPKNSQPAGQTSEHVKRKPSTPVEHSAETQRVYAPDIEGTPPPSSPPTTSTSQPAKPMPSITPPEKPKAAQQFQVLVAAFTQKNTALRLIRALERSNVGAANLIELKSSKRLRYQVLLGPYSELATAQRIVRSIQGRFRAHPQIIHSTSHSSP